MAHLNPEVVADALIASNTPIEKFKSAVYNDEHLSRELDSLIKEVREKIAEQRNSEQYAIKFWSEVLEHLEHHKEACASPLMENKMKKYVVNPVSQERNTVIDELMSVAEDFFDACEDGNFHQAKKELSTLAYVISVASNQLEKFSSAYLKQMGEVISRYNIIVTEYIKKDRFNTSHASALLKSIDDFSNLGAM
jgi:hypothetical protein